MPSLTLLPLLALLSAAEQGGDAREGRPAAIEHQTAAAAEPYPAIAVLDAFRAACAGSGSQAGLRDAAVADGWTLVTDPSATPLREVMADVRRATQAMLGQNPGATNDDALLRRVVAGETVYLQMSQTTIGAFTAGECRLYDPGETRAIPTEVVTQWMGRGPIEAMSHAEYSRDRWSPALDGRDGKFGTTLLVEGGRLAQSARFVGLMITTDRTPDAR
jgi:hypothetical protein